MRAIASHKSGIVDAVALMRRRRISVVDLLEVDHRSAPPKKIRGVDVVWALLARHGLKYADLEAAGLKFENKIPELPIRS